MAVQTDSHVTIEYSPSAEPLLSPDVQVVVDGALAILLLEARANDADHGAITIDGFTYVEEGHSQIVITHWVTLQPEAALDYWDRLATAVHEWALTLQPDLKGIALGQFAVAVRWSIDEDD
jgi:hypothetical protein